MRIRRWAVLVGALVVALVAAGLAYAVYVDPATDVVTAADPADAVVALAGMSGTTSTAQTVVERGGARELVLSHAYGPHDGDLYVRTNELCRARSTGYRITCVMPDPRTTRGEARVLARLARERGWTDVVVVASTSHVSRARVIVGRCYSGRLRMVQAEEQAGPVGWSRNVIYETAAFAKAAILRGC